jgi:hypothetical protein
MGTQSTNRLKLVIATLLWWNEGIFIWKMDLLSFIPRSSE